MGDILFLGYRLQLESSGQRRFFSPCFIYYWIDGANVIFFKVGGGVLNLVCIQNGNLDYDVLLSLYEACFSQHS